MSDKQRGRLRRKKPMRDRRDSWNEKMDRKERLSREHMKSKKERNVPSVLLQ